MPPRGVLVRRAAARRDRSRPRVGARWTPPLSNVGLCLVSVRPRRLPRPGSACLPGARVARGSWVPPPPRWGSRERFKKQKRFFLGIKLLRAPVFFFFSLFWWKCCFGCFSHSLLLKRNNRDGDKLRHQLCYWQRRPPPQPALGPAGSRVCLCARAPSWLPLFSPCVFQFFQISPYYCCDSACPCFCRYAWSPPFLS